MIEIIKENSDRRINNPFLDYPELYSVEITEYFSNITSESLENLDDLALITHKLKYVQNIVLKITSDNVMALNHIVHGIHKKEKEAGVNSWWDVDTSILTSDEVLFMICYPFWGRMCGSWEVRFATSGMLGKYLKLYKEKVGELK